MEKIFKIYKIQFPNGKVYIGQSVNYKNRWREHLREAARGNDLKIYRAMRKYNITIEAFSIIEDNITSQDEANSKEIYYIKEFNSIKNKGKSINVSTVIEILSVLPSLIR